MDSTYYYYLFLLFGIDYSQSCKYNNKSEKSTIVPLVRQG